MTARVIPELGALGLVVGLLFGCGESDLEEDPELRVPGFEVTPAPAMNPAMPTGGAPPEFDPALAVPDHDPLPPPPMPPGMPPGGIPPGGMVPDGMQPNGAVTLIPGFQPDPMILRGQMGGPVDARSMNAACVGAISQQPNHILQVGAAFTYLRIVVNAEADATLVIRAPDGSLRCNDDAVPQNTDGVPPELNPLIEGAFPPGAYSVWVGRFGGAEPSPYAIGFTVSSSVRPTHIR